MKTSQAPIIKHTRRIYQYGNTCNFRHNSPETEQCIFKGIASREKKEKGRRKREKKRDSAKSEKENRRWTDANSLWCTLIARSGRKINRGYFRAACSCAFLFYTFVEIVSFAFRGGRIPSTRTHSTRASLLPFPRKVTEHVVAVVDLTVQNALPTWSKICIRKM